jgi:hypothetical protein
LGLNLLQRVDASTHRRLGLLDRRDDGAREALDQSNPVAGGAMSPATGNEF